MKFKEYKPYHVWRPTPPKATAKAILRLKVNSSVIPEFYSSIAVDAACSGNPGLMEYRGVVTSTGDVIFHLGPFPDSTNNIGEFLALVHGLAHLNKTEQFTTPVYTDSLTARAWVRDKKIKSKIKPTERNAKVFELVQRALVWLETHSYQNPILVWDTPNWGEIPADFGRKG
jgi:ribonuclease HI